MGKRHILVEGIPWEYEVGKTSCAAWHESFKVVAPLTEVLDMTLEEIDQAKWRRYFCVRPRDIAKWLRPHSMRIARSNQFK